MDGKLAMINIEYNDKDCFLAVPYWGSIGLKAKFQKT